jgi:hypothetical protein
MLDSFMAAALPEGANMLITVAIILVLLWVLGFATSYTMGGLLHVLLVLAAVAIVARVIQGRQLSNDHTPR